MRLVRAVHEARKDSAAPGGTVILRLPEPRLEIPLDPELPEVAYQSLAEIEQSRARLAGILSWDNETQAWVDTAELVLRCEYPRCLEQDTQGRTRQVSESRMEHRRFYDRHATSVDTGDQQAWA
jgi:hypothetical protein